MEAIKLFLITATATLAVAAPAAAQVHVMRHADTPAGERDPELTVTGAARAAALTGWFKGKRLRAIYVTDYKRARATAAPLAAARALQPIVYDPADTPALVARAAAERGPVLIVGHSNTVPEIVAQLGGTRPPAIPHAQFGDIWTVHKGRTTHLRVEPEAQRTEARSH